MARKVSRWTIAATRTPFGKHGTRCAAGFVLFAWESPVSAQAKPTREGGWLSLGVGYGSARVSCDTCQTGRHTDGLDVLLAIGGTPSPHWCAGAMLEVWEHWFPGGD